MSGSSPSTESLYNHVKQRNRVTHSGPWPLGVKELGASQVRRWVGVLRKSFTSVHARVLSPGYWDKGCKSKGNLDKALTVEGNHRREAQEDIC